MTRQVQGLKGYYSGCIVLLVEYFQDPSMSAYTYSMCEVKHCYIRWISLLKGSGGELIANLIPAIASNASAGRGEGTGFLQTIHHVASNALSRVADNILVMCVALSGGCTFCVVAARERLQQDNPVTRCQMRQSSAQSVSSLHALVEYCVHTVLMDQLCSPPRWSSCRWVGQCAV